MAESFSYRLARAVNRILGNPLDVNKEEPDPEPRGSIASELSVVTREWEQLFGLTYSRRLRYQDYDRMDTGDMATLLDTVVDSCTISDDGRLYGFSVEGTGPKVTNLLNSVIQRCDLIEIARQSLRDCLKYGDEFVGLTIDQNGDVVYTSPLPVDTMIARVDSHNRLKTGEESPDGVSPPIPAAYWQIGGNYLPIAGWYPWEMCHLKYRPTRKNPYSATSLFEDSRPRWHKLRMMEEAMAIARIVRAYIRLVHKLDVTGKPTEEAKALIKEYMDAVKKSKLVADSTTGSRATEKRIIGVDEDLFYTTGYITAPNGELKPMLSGVDSIDPQNTGLRYIPDVDYMQRGLFTRVSGEVVGLPGDREDVGMQDIASSRFYQWCQKGVLENQLLRPIFDLSLRLKGYQPGRVSYKITWPSVIIETSWRFADAGFRRSMMDTYYIEAGIVPRQYIANSRYGIPTDKWESEWLPLIKKEMEEFGALDMRSSAAQQRRIGNQAT